MRRIGPLLLVVIGGLLLAGSIALGLYTQAVNNPGSEPTPNTLAGLSLSQLSTGQAAVKEVASLHGQGFPLVSGAIAVYGGGAATVWVTGTLLDPLAAQMVTAMETRIAQGNSPFTPAGRRTALDGRAVHELTGMGQRHFYFQAGRRVVWLAADAALAEPALTELLAFYPR